MSKWLHLAQRHIAQGASQSSAECRSWTSGSCANSAISVNSPQDRCSDGVPLVPIVPKGQDPGAIGTIGTIGTAPEIDANLAERQALLEIDGHVPPVFSLAFAALQMGCPQQRRVEDWLRAVDDAGRFLDRHGSRAALLGWTAEALFAADGLAWALKGAAVTSLTAATATLSDGRTFRTGGQS